MSSDGLVTLLLNSRPQQIHCNAQGKGSCQTCLERSVAYSTLILTEYDERRFGLGPFIMFRRTALCAVEECQNKVSRPVETLVRMEQ